MSQLQFAAYIFCFFKNNTFEDLPLEFAWYFQ